MDATPHAGHASRRQRLEALRDSLQAVMDDGVGARDFAALSREYRATMAELASIEATDAKAGDPVDEIAARRAARGAVAAPVSDRTAANPH